MREHEPHIDSLARSVEYHKRQLAEERARLGRRRRLIPVWLRMPVLKDGERKKRGRILIAIGWIMVIAVSLIVGFSQYIRSDGNLFRSIALGAAAFLGAYAFAWWLWAIGYYLRGRLSHE